MLDVPLSDVRCPRTSNVLLLFMSVKVSFANAGIASVASIMPTKGITAKLFIKSLPFILAHTSAGVSCG